MGAAHEYFTQYYNHHPSMRLWRGIPLLQPQNPEKKKTESERNSLNFLHIVRLVAMKYNTQYNIFITPLVTSTLFNFLIVTFTFQLNFHQ